jgi:RNA polymerase sigma-70 factor (ECF subfamily)
MHFPAASIENRLVSSALAGNLFEASLSFMGLSDRPKPLPSISASDPHAGRSDAELVVALQADLPWARREIWTRYSGQVRRYLARALGRPSPEVEDLTQEVFLRIFTRRAAIRRPEALREFTMAVAVRVLKWNLRSRWIRRIVGLSADGELPDVIADRGAEEETNDALRRCRLILDSLGMRERVAFSLRFLEEMTMEEVAKTMGVSLSTAKRLVNGATANIAEQVGRDADLRRYFLDRSGGSK